MNPKLSPGLVECTFDNDSQRSFVKSQVITCWLSYSSYDSSTFQNRKPSICSIEHVYSSFDNRAKLFLEGSLKVQK